MEIIQDRFFARMMHANGVAKVIVCKNKKANTFTLKLAE